MTTAETKSLLTRINKEITDGARELSEISDDLQKNIKDWGIPLEIFEAGLKRGPKELENIHFYILVCLPKDQRETFKWPL